MRDRSRIDLTSPVNWSHPLNRGLVLWMLALPQWSGGNTWFDLCRRSNGTLTNGPAWRPASRPGGFGELSFDGTNQDVVVTNNAAINLSGDMTISAWVYLTATPSGVHYGIAEKGNTGGGQPYGIQSHNADRLFQWSSFDGSQHQINSNTAIPLNTWQFVLASRSGTTVTLYQDAKSTGSGTGGGSGNSSDLTIGGLNNGNDTFWPGRIDDLRLYNRALAVVEVAALYDLGRRGYPGVLRRVGTGRFVSSQAPPPGNIVCADASLSPRVAARANTGPGVAATASTGPRVAARANVEEC